MVLTLSCSLRDLNIGIRLQIGCDKNLYTSDGCDILLIPIGDDWPLFLILHAILIAHGGYAMNTYVAYHKSKTHAHTTITDNNNNLTLIGLLLIG